MAVVFKFFWFLGRSFPWLILPDRREGGLFDQPFPETQYKHVYTPI